MKPIIRDFLVGSTAIAGIAGLIGGLVFFGEFSFDRHYSFKVKLSNAAGLDQASRVTMSGVNIGQVTDAEILPATVGGVLLSVKVKERVQIPRKAVVGIEKGLIGDASLDFAVRGKLTEAETTDVIKPGEIFDGGNPATLFDRIAGVIEGPLGRLTVTAEKVNKLADVYTVVGERFSDALEPRTVAEVAAGKPPNLRSTIERLDRTLAGADEWLSDEAIKKQVRDVIARADTVMTDAQELIRAARSSAEKIDRTVEDASTAIKSFGNAAAKVEDKIGSVSDQAMSTLRKTEDAAGKLAEALETATHGPGTVGQLMQNPDLYNSLHDAAERLDRALVELQLLLEKFKAEGIRLRL